ncbi:MAG: 16S rRNA (uracil(1498)-N(3))-methyltransferase [Verrucomicrobiota bacterium]
MSLPRFYIPPQSWNPDALILPQDEAKHALSALRLTPGERLVAFNGQGHEATAEIAAVDDKQPTLNTLNSTRTDPLPLKLVLGQAIPKGKNMDLIVQKATELGAHTILPILSERTIVQLDPAEAKTKQNKWQRTAIEACKQSGQNWLPVLAPPQTLGAALKLFSNQPRTLLLIASLTPGTRHLKEILAEYHDLHGPDRPETAVILIGPEGDFTPAEYNLARTSGCQPLSLGPIILRTETAAFHALSILGYELFHSPSAQ